MPWSLRLLTNAADVSLACQYWRHAPTWSSNAVGLPSVGRPAHLHANAVDLLITHWCLILCDCSLTPPTSCLSADAVNLTTARWYHNLLLTCKHWRHEPAWLSYVVVCSLTHICIIASNKFGRPYHTCIIWSCKILRNIVCLIIFALSMFAYMHIYIVHAAAIINFNTHHKQFLQRRWTSNKITKQGY